MHCIVTYTQPLVLKSRPKLTFSLFFSVTEDVLPFQFMISLPHLKWLTSGDQCFCDLMITPLSLPWGHCLDSSRAFLIMRNMFWEKIFQSPDCLGKIAIIFYGLIPQALLY
ncbi:unnamed protein product [Sphenostylis stenocarpa]|uniref:Uncharacterized protein n=1 Tax=Sphenostylis stenocarpa TaxID=92480 RepID=A0AA86SHZ1_9FABA|nr:unnamed protein product [Sphenostylis stenocarpa]